MRILHVYKTYFPDTNGGVEEAIRQICLATEKFGVINTIFALSKHPIPKTINHSEALIVRSRSWISPASCDIGGPDSVIQFKKLVKECDIVFYHFPWPYADILKKFISNDKPSVVLYHSDIVRQKFLGHVYRPLMLHTLRSASAIVATSPAYAKTSEILNLQDLKHKVHIVPLGIGDDALYEDQDTSIFQRLGINISDKYILFLGVHRYYKGLHNLVEAAKKANTKIVLAGDGPETPKLQALVSREGIQNIIFAGRVSNAEKNALLKNCYAFVLPSHLRSEAFGVVLIEAALFGKPLITCEIGTGTTYVNENNETGLVVPANNSESLSSAINYLIEHEDVAKTMGFSAYQRYKKLFSRDCLGHKYFSIYKEIIVKK